LSACWLLLLCLPFGCKGDGTAPSSARAAELSAPLRPAPPPEPAATSSDAADAGTPPRSSLPALRPGGKDVAQGRYGMVVSVEAQASAAGVRMLQAGGNAIDAAVATAYALAVTHPSAGNLGGGGYLLIARPGQPTLAIDFRERAPQGLTVSHFEAMLADGARGPAASAVPGSVAGLNLAQRDFGRLPLHDVLQPAIELARLGHRVGEREASTLRWSWKDLRRDPASWRNFAGSAGPVQEGDWLVRPDLAHTLERIAEAGDAGFYRGKTGRAIVAAMRRGGLISARDLQSYRAEAATPIELRYRGYEVSTAPSSGGVIVAQLLLSLEKFGAFRLLPGSPDELHLFAELARRAQADRRYGAALPSATEDSGSSALAERLERFARLDFVAFDPWQATPSTQFAHGTLPGERESEHTTQLSVVDREGNAVSCTTTLSASFGARYVVPGTGIVMNNSLAGFGIGAANQPRAGRRIQSSMAPTLVSHVGQVVAVLGSPGGDTIPSTVVQVLRHLVDHDMTLDQAIEAPRIHHGFFPDELRLERGRTPDPSVLEELQARGHRLHIRPTAIGAANEILVVDGVAYGHADSREGGLALPAPPPLR